MQLAVLGGQHAVAADEAAGGSGLGVVLHHEEVPTRAVGTEERGRESSSQRRVAGLGRGLGELAVHVVGGVADRREQVRIVTHLLQTTLRVVEDLGGSRAASG